MIDISDPTRTWMSASIIEELRPKARGRRFAFTLTAVLILAGWLPTFEDRS